MDKEEILTYFTNLSVNDPNLSAAVAAIKTLIHLVEVRKVGTISEMRVCLKEAIKILTETDSSTTSISSAGELFLRFIPETNNTGKFRHSRVTKNIGGKRKLVFR